MQKYIRSIVSSFLSVIGGFNASEFQPIVFQQLYSMDVTKNNSAANAQIASAPGVNRFIPFPYGEKSNALMLDSVAQGFVPFAIISQKSPVDTENMSRISLPSGTLSSVFSNAIHKLGDYIPALQNKKNLKVVPKLLIIKQPVMGIMFPAGIVGIELNFPPAERTFLGDISRIAFIFVQQITKENTDQILQNTGFNSIAVNNAHEKKMLLLNETKEQREYSKELIQSLITDLKSKNSILLRPFLSKLDTVLNSLANTTIGLIIEGQKDLLSELNSFDTKYGLTHVFLSNDHYLFWKKSNTNADKIAHLIQKHKMPIASNYYLFGRIMGYSDEDIRLKYQIEGYLRSTDQLNADGSVAWPYNICKWGIENGMKFNDWVKNKWNVKLYLLSSDKIQRKQYEKDKKDAQKYIVLLPMSMQEAEKLLAGSEKPHVSSNIVKKERPVPIVPPTLSGTDLQKEYDQLFNACQEFLETKYTDNSFELFAKKVTQLKDPSLKIAALKYILNPAMAVDNVVKPGVRKVEKISFDNTINTMYKESNFSNEDVNEYTLTFGKQSKKEKYEKIIRQTSNLKKSSIDATIKQQKVTELEDKFITALLLDFFKIGLEKVKERVDIK